MAGNRHGEGFHARLQEDPSIYEPGADYEAAVALLGSITGLDFVKTELLCACHARLGQDEKARSESAVILRARPEFRLTDIGLWKSFHREADRKHLFDALRSAGLPV